MLLDVFVHPDKTVLFVLAALSLVPLAWLIGEATEHAGEHTGPRIGPAVVLLGLYLAVTIADLKRRPTHHVTDASGWSLRASLVILGVTTAATAVTSEILVHSLQAFAAAANLSEFFIAVVIVAI